jgi:hypothetical protein
LGNPVIKAFERPGNAWPFWFQGIADFLPGPFAAYATPTGWQDEEKAT